MRRILARPRKIESVEAFDELVDTYIDSCKTSESPVTLPGLICALGLSSRHSLAHYEKRKEFCDSVKRAKLYVEMEYEKRLQGNSSTGAIFALKNFGWSDRQELALDQATTTPSEIKIHLVSSAEGREAV